MNLKRIMSFVLCILMLCSCVLNVGAETGADNKTNADVAQQIAEELKIQTQTEPEKPMFTDVPLDAPYADAVKKLVEYGIISGYPDGTFKPDGEVTRAEMCKMINLTLGYTDFTDAVGFTDVTTNNWFYAFALAAQKAGYVKGYEDGSFGGSRNITRQEVCTILVRLLKPMDLGIPVTISDPVAGWAKKDVELVVQNFIMPLEEYNTFRATENLKRHELATVLSNLAVDRVTTINADIRFFVNGVQYGQTQTLAVGSVANVPEDPKPSDNTYEFAGWRVVGTDTATDAASIIVLNDVDYEAVFVKKSYNVIFDVRTSVYDEQTVEHGEIAEAPENPVIKGYEFLGWSLYENGDPVRVSSTKITSDTVFYAVFVKELAGGGGNNGGGGGDTNKDEPKTYTVKFFVNGDVYETQTVEKNDSPKSVADPVRGGYDFVGWSLSLNGEIVELSAIDVTSNITLYAVFEKQPEPEPEEYTVTFINDGTTFKELTVTEGSTAPNPGTPSMDGYNFVGWSEKEFGPVVILGYYTITKDTTFYAVYEKKIVEKKYFDVNFYVDGKLHDSTSVQEGLTASAPQAPSKEGYNFRGWSLSESGSVVSLSSVVINEKTNFYAVFEKKPEEIVYYKATFMVDGREFDSAEIKKGGFVEEPEQPEKEGYNFKGWAESKNSTAIVDVTKKPVTADVTYYAVFEKIEEVKVYFDVKFVSDGKTVSTQSILDGSYPVVPDEPGKDGFIFLGWSKSENGTTVKPEKLAVTANVTYYAVFEEKEVEVKFYSVYFWVKGEIYQSFDIADGGKITIPADPEVAEGDTFIGWSLKENGNKNNLITESDKIITEHTDFYAVIVGNPNSAELIEKLTRGHSQLKSIRISNAKQKAARNAIVSCIGMVLEDANNGIYISKDYVTSNYSDEVEEVSDIINNQMNDNERSNFINMLTNTKNIDEDVQDFLIDYFDLSTNV